MRDDQDLEYEAAIHLNLPLTEGFYPEWDGSLELSDEDLDDEAAERRLLAEIDADDPSKIFDALCDAGIM